MRRPPGPSTKLRRAPRSRRPPRRLRWEGRLHTLPERTTSLASRGTPPALRALSHIFPLRPVFGRIDDGAWRKVSGTFRHLVEGSEVQARSGLVENHAWHAER